MNSRSITHSTTYAGHGPKYSQVIDLILKKIEKKVFSAGDRIPSIKEASEEYLISRDTVEKAYKELSQRGVLISVPGKGYYVKGKSSARMKVMALMPAMQQEEQAFYNAFLQGLGKQAISHLFCFGENPDLFRDTLRYHLGDYDYYLVWPKLVQDHPEVKRLIAKIPQNKLIRVGAAKPTSTAAFAASIVENLQSSGQAITKYDSWSLLFPESIHPIQVEWKNAILEAATQLEKEVTETSVEALHTLPESTLCFTWDDQDLIQLLQYTQTTGKAAGNEIGVLSLQEHPLKKALAGGITTLSLATTNMGQYAAQLVLKQAKDSLAFVSKLIVRASV